MVSVIVLTPPAGITSGLNTLVIVGADTLVTSRSSVAVPLSGASAVEITPVVFVCVPTVVEVTSTVISQLPLAGIVPAAMLILLPPSALVNVPPHVLASLSGVALVIAPGYVSLRLADVSATAFGFVRVSVIVAVPPIDILLGAIVFVSVGASNTSSDALAVVLSGASVVSTTPVVLL